MKNKLEKLATQMMSLTPEEGEQLALIIKAKAMPEIAKQQQQQQQQQGLLQQNPQAQQQMAQMGQRRGGQQPMPNARMAAQQGLLK
tara:strand:- start:1 stop:258 length:258 start_codon:yes stop_codon:yes gene_type:complete